MFGGLFSHEREIHVSINRNSNNLPISRVKTRFNLFAIFHTIHLPMPSEQYFTL